MSKTDKIIIEIVFFAVVGLVCFGTMFYLEGHQQSISKYGLNSPTSYFFKFWLLTLIVGAYRNRRLKYTIPAIIGIILFNADSSLPTINTLHNISAVLFFGITTLSFMLHKPSRLTAILMLCTYPVYFYDIFIGELLTISVMYFNFIRKAFALKSKKL